MTIIPPSVGCRPGRLRTQPLSRDGDSFYGRTDQDEIDTRNEIYQELAKDSIPRFVSPAESAITPQTFKSRRQLHSQRAECESYVIASAVVAILQAKAHARWKHGS
jgi:hypothetical protein